MAAVVPARDEATRRWRELPVSSCRFPVNDQTPSVNDHSSPNASMPDPFATRSLDPRIPLLFILTSDFCILISEFLSSL